MSQRVVEGGALAFALTERGAGLVLCPRAHGFHAPSCCPQRMLLRDAQIPQARRLHLRAFARLFTAEVRPVIAEMENSFFSLAFIYTLIKETFAHRGLAARDVGQTVIEGARGDRRGTRSGQRRGKPGHPLCSGLCTAGLLPPREKSVFGGLFLSTLPPPPCLAIFFANAQKNKANRVYFGRFKPKERSDPPHSLRLRFRYPERGGGGRSSQPASLCSVGLQVLKASCSPAQAIWGLSLCTSMPANPHPHPEPIK